MKLMTVDDFLTWHNTGGGFLRCPVIVQLDNEPPFERELSLFFFSRLEGGPNGAYDYWVRSSARKQDLDLSRMIVVGFRPIMVTDAGFFKALKANVSDGFVLLVKAHPIETFEGDKIHELNRRADLGAIREKLADLYTELEDLDPDHMRELSDSIADLWPQSEADVKMSEALVRLDDVVQVLEEVLCAVAAVRR